MVLFGTDCQEGRLMTLRKSPASKGASKKEATKPEVRARILDAAFAAFLKSGYAATSTLEIATRARVSKRELYALWATSRKCSSHASAGAPAATAWVPADLPVPHDREIPSRTCTGFPRVRNSSAGM